MAKAAKHQYTGTTEVTAALYVRVSTLHQVGRDSIPMQKQDLVSYAQLILHASRYEVFEDSGYSGKNTDRPKYQEMMARVRRHEFTHILVWKIDRISRNLLDFASMYAELKKLGVVFVSRNEQFDTSSAMGEAMLKIILVFAELERNMTSERVTAAMISRAGNGLWNGGRVPYGYSYDRASKSFSIVPSESRDVVAMMDDYEQSLSLVRTARSLNDAGKRTREGNLWSPVTVWTVLRNPWYKGVYRYNYYSDPGMKVIKDSSEWVFVDGHHPRLISDERFDRINALLDVNSRFRMSPGHPKQSKYSHVFSGILRCGLCHSVMTCSPGRLHADGYRSFTYKCPGNRTGACDGSSVSDTVVGDFLVNYIINVLRVCRPGSGIEPEGLQDALLRGDVFSSVASVEGDGLDPLRSVLSSGKQIRLDKPSSRKKAEPPELRALRSDLRKNERALERLARLYLYSDKSMAESENVMQSSRLKSASIELRKQISDIACDDGLSYVTDTEFVQKAAGFVLSRELEGRDYVYYRRLASDTDPEQLYLFFHGILDMVEVIDGNVKKIIFKNGMLHSFTYRDGKQH